MSEQLSQVLLSLLCIIVSHSQTLYQTATLRKRVWWTCNTDFVPFPRNVSGVWFLIIKFSREIRVVLNTVGCSYLKLHQRRAAKPQRGQFPQQLHSPLNLVLMFDVKYIHIFQRVFSRNEIVYAYPPEPFSA